MAEIMSRRKNQQSANRFKWRDVPSLLKSSFSDWNDDDAFSNAAAVSYYAIFSMPALLLLIIDALGFLLGKQNAQEKIMRFLGNTLGPQTSDQIQTMISHASTQANST